MAEKKIRLAVQTDLKQILGIYDWARRFMAENGNPTQWGTSHPAQCVLEEDIRRERLYVVTQDDIICGVFMFTLGDDPTYAYIEGNWHSDSPYGVIHRIAGSGGGILAAALAHCSEIISHLRIDTHADNKPMQRAIEKAGFSKCGIIYVEDGTPRIAYDRI